MSFEPERFFIGVIDLFAVILPGALLTYLAKDTVGFELLGPAYYALVGPEGWFTFLFVSYLTGHVIFLIGSGIVDDRCYGPIRDATYANQIQRLAKGRDLSPRLLRFFADHMILKDSEDHALRQANAIRRSYLDPVNGSSSINTFQWSKAMLRFDQPAAMANVERLEADSKFFRSFFVLLAFLTPWLFIQRGWLVALAAAVLALLSFLRYFDQRLKSTTQAYWYVIALDARRERPSGSRRGPPRTPTHAGGIVVRPMGRDLRDLHVLLVEATKPPHHFVLPKGHIDPPETPAEAAVREVREETGTWARVIERIGDFSFTDDQTRVFVEVHSMQFLESSEESVWWPLPSARPLDRVWDANQSVARDRASKWVTFDDELLTKLPVESRAFFQRHRSALEEEFRRARDVAKG